ncbi:hypothetical protein OHA_1_02571 [Pleomorphomonas sp. SM30]|nr:hypothetical protein OHA_1_02571 [Pleomorphomonas sp. SM30]
MARSKNAPRLKRLISPPPALVPPKQKAITKEWIELCPSPIASDPIGYKITQVSFAEGMCLGVSPEWCVEVSPTFVVLVGRFPGSLLAYVSA